jgi:hypothetical protein
MTYNPARGPGKGPASGKPAKPFTRADGGAHSPEAARKGGKNAAAAAKKAALKPEEKAAIAAAKAEGGVRAMFREFRKMNPDYQAKPEILSRKAIEHVLYEGSPDALQRLHDEIMDPLSTKGVDAAKAWLEHTKGRPSQSVDLTASISKAKPASNEEVMAEIAELSEALGLKYQLFEVVEDDLEEPSKE